MTELNSTNKFSNNYVIEASYLGRVDFQRAVQLQKDLLTLSQQTKNNFIIGLEHPAVMTLGYRANVKEEIFDEDALPIEYITRGGLATIHSEGQLVIYPVLNLRELNLGVRQYVLLLLETTQELLNSLGIQCLVDEKAIGLYTENGKIAFCGIQVKNGISQHGLSLNVRNDLSLFAKIRACGVSSSHFDSLRNYNIDLTLSKLYLQWVQIFRTKIS